MSPASDPKPLAPPARGWRKTLARLRRGPTSRPARLRDDSGAAAAEFVIVFPLMFSIFLASVDFGVMMLRQLFLERALDIATREVRLGHISSNGVGTMTELICRNTTMLPNCAQRLTIEMRPIDTATFAGLNDPFRCIDLQQPVTPALTFNPGRGYQELMLIRVCATANPFLRLTAYMGGLAINPQGDHQIVARSVFVNE